MLWCPGLAQTTGRPGQSVQEWLSTSNFAPNVTGSTLELTGIVTSDILNSLGYDINRLSSAASETLRNIAEIPQIPKSLAWPYVKFYYSALFYAHSLLRIWGRSPSYLRTADFLHIRNTLAAYGVTSPFKLQTGQFLLTINTAQSAVSLTTDKGGGGTHDAIWREFEGALSDLKQAVNASQFLAADKVMITIQIDRAMGLLTRGGSNAAWPSFMRNEIHYRQAEGVWYPYRGRSKTSELCSDASRALNGGLDLDVLLSANGDDLSKFRCACLFVIAYARQSLDDLSGIGGNKGFLRYGQARFENAYP